LSLAHAAERRRAEACWTRVLGALVAAMDAHAAEQHGHSQRVHALAMLLAGRLGLDPEGLEALHWAALLHDIGKMGMPDVEGRPARTAASPPGEHARCGCQMLQGIEELQRAAAAIHHHHEHWDGSGGPDGLQGSAIPPEARIIGVADAFDVLTSRGACSLEAAVRRIESESGSRFDPQTVRALQGLLPLLAAHSWLLLSGPQAPGCD
jgi:putative nucleotidyltransferase with HDIG domain